MPNEIVIALLALVGTAIGTWGGIMTANKLTNYRIAQLEKKVDLHNSVIERMTIAEQNIKATWHQIDEIKDEIKTKK